MSTFDEADTTRRGFLKTVGAATAAAAAPGGTLQALATPDTVKPDETFGVNELRQALADEIKLIHDSAEGGRDQTDHIIDELGDLYYDIEDSGDEVALTAYETMMDTIDTDPETQAAAAVKAVKMLEKGVIPGGTSQVAQTAASTAARTQVAPAATAAVSAFKELVQRVMSAGQTAAPQAQNQISPASTSPALPASDRSAAEIMAQLRDIVGRDLTPQEQQVVGQEMSKSKS
jgi:hypothetical protein